jgi:hypothetical protein
MHGVFWARGLGKRGRTADSPRAPTKVRRDALGDVQRKWEVQRKRIRWDKEAKIPLDKLNKMSIIQRIIVVLHYCTMSIYN